MLNYEKYVRTVDILTVLNRYGYHYIDDNDHHHHKDDEHQLGDVSLSVLMYLGTHAGSWCIYERAKRCMQYKHEDP